jgi:hypothetical protein
VASFGGRHLIKARDFIFLVVGGAVAAFALIALYVFVSATTLTPARVPTHRG